MNAKHNQKNVVSSKPAALKDIRGQCCSDELLETALSSGIISAGDIQSIIFMNKKRKVLALHPYAIRQGKGKDQRWFTTVKDKSYPEGRRKIGKSTEEEIYDYLYKYYFIYPAAREDRTLTELYEEWINYKLATVSRSNTVHRYDSDYQRFYVKEPLSIKIMTTPLSELTVADIKEWASQLVKKYHLTKKAYYGATTVLRQVYEYLIDKEELEKNPFNRVRINKDLFRKSGKKPAATQIFYADEIELICSACFERALEEKDVAWLAIPLFFHTGLRIGECLALLFRDCDQEEHTIYIHQMLAVMDERLPDGTWMPRRFEIIDYLKGNGDPRDIIVSDKGFEIINLIRKIHHANKRISDLLFPDITENNVQAKLYKICRESGVAERSPHKWRKTYISTLLNNGVDPDFVRNQVGHKDIQTTYNSYTYSTTRKEEQVKQLNEVLSV